MHHQSEYFGPNEAISIQGGAGAFGGPSQSNTISHSDLALMGSSSNNGSNMEENLRLFRFLHEDPNVHHPTSAMGLDLQCQPGLDPRADKITTTSLMQANNHQYYFDPTTPLNPLVIGMLNPGNFHYTADMFSGELPPDSTSTGSTILHDPMVHLDFPSQPSLVKDVLNSLPHDTGFFPGTMGFGGSFVGGLDDGYDGQLGRQRSDKKGRKGGSKKGGSIKVEEAGSLKNEKQRRERIAKKYDDLKSLIPNSTKQDRASIIADATDYVNELLRTLKELKILVAEKRHRREWGKKLIMGDGVDGDVESSSMKPLMGDGDRAFRGSLRSSWIQRKSRETFVDVRITEDEVYIKLTQRKKMNCLVVVSKVLDELQLELLHLSGGNIGDSHIFIFNTKIHEGSSVYASAVAKKLIEVLDVQYPPLPVSF
ncbi:transcription factor EAT1-like [Elaeis guineensis]|uniref:Transcription factor EAT1-like n=1 Tax=Elaeis guineensis var. tenera TaxID=51953 RepID=A0A6I9S690_ELAGV|nr:transcription factor EAT1-like [Elaeis guineensis]